MTAVQTKHFEKTLIIVGGGFATAAKIFLVVFVNITDIRSFHIHTPSLYLSPAIRCIFRESDQARRALLPFHRGDY
jgi:hypothetical protein